MIQLIVGEKGKGKTKHLLEKVNTEIKSASGNIVYLDKNTKHMYELCNKVRLINVKDYPINNSDEFVGFISGIISQDHDLEQVYLDSFLEIACICNNLESTIHKLSNIGEKYHIKFVLSVSLNENEISEDLKQNIIISL
ncbi:twitching motility protein PilT [Anaerosacchariphilus polymeriproducens]|uniref:Twitching motility protein PilT n=1 Tax=Anaerosacchariphilus polymeriproducens TaxID=1812858 RepID=A0A371AU15_9FIRM|nr:twitching motility protein PilT [Anaerosacchariphilus polymeriproducens]RDU23055.1 twitching motility protein PilT [Anaerosacchariphilus polymeriproducens]